MNTMDPGMMGMWAGMAGMGGASADAKKMSANFMAKLHLSQIVVADNPPKNVGTLEFAMFS